MRPIYIAAIGALSLAPLVAEATGDIYVGTDAYGNVFFTDTPPTYAGFSRFLKAPSRSGSTWAEYHTNFTAFDDLITEHSKSQGLKASLVKAVIFAESAFNPTAVSHAGAQGLMQLMPHVQVNLGVTNSFDPSENIGGGTRLLSELLTRYKGDTKLALAAYNAGPRAVDKYGGVPPYAETRDYVDKVMAMEVHFRSRGLSVKP